MNRLCNDRSRPVIFLGTSDSMSRLVDVCNINEINVKGIIDSDYYGNTPNISNIPVIDTEESFSNPEKLKYYRENFNFFCATNWTPEPNLISQRNREKRLRHINILDTLELTVISIVDPWSRISESATIGRGVFIDCFTIIENGCNIGDYVSVYGQSGIGHHTKLMRNTVIQRYCSIAGGCTFEPNNYVGTSVKALKTGAVFGENTVIHECIYIRRGTVNNEIVKQHGKNMKRVKVHG